MTVVENLNKIKEDKNLKSSTVSINYLSYERHAEKLPGYHDAINKILIMKTILENKYHKFT
ncbi:hypothetical protein [Leuconostoc gelidum]|uniref:hypothetical protein n=1 Tax=Leuconostoc gelidum TaxID=1244 RepID=UPI0002E78AEF|nr:hypothetical protein [Leuconostoc gelidum]GMA68168.1 hypothetical protein GCM10025884_17950 [Leuconostoc gelidum subsp. gelidum]